jgi:hypothetical protein
VVHVQKNTPVYLFAAIAEAAEKTSNCCRYVLMVGEIREEKRTEEKRR